MRACRMYPQANPRIKVRINQRGRDATDWRRRHDHGSRGAIRRHINPWRIGVTGRRRTVCHRPADHGADGKSANDACRHRPAAGTGIGNPCRGQGENDRRNRRDFHKLFHIDPLHKTLLSFADPMLPHPALFHPRPSVFLYGRIGVILHAMAPGTGLIGGRRARGTQPPWDQTKAEARGQIRPGECGHRTNYVDFADSKSRLSPAGNLSFSARPKE